MKKTLGIFMLGILLAVTTGCSGEENIEAQSQKDSNIQTVETEGNEKEGVLKENKKIYVCFGSEENYQTFLKAKEEKDFEYDLFEGKDLGGVYNYSYMLHYPSENFVIQNTIRMIDEAGEKMSVDGTIDKIFLEDGQTINTEGYKELTVEEAYFLNATFSFDGIQKYNAIFTEKVNTYEQSEEKFENYRRAVELNGSVLAMFYGEMEAKNEYVSQMLGLINFGEEYSPFLTLESEMDNNIKYAKQAFEDKTNIYHIEVMNSTDDELFNKDGALNSLSSIKEKESDLTYKISELNEMKKDIEDMIPFYIALGEYFGEEINQEMLMDEELIQEYKNIYDSYIKVLESELENIELYKEKVSETNLNFFL